MFHSPETKAGGGEGGGRGNPGHLHPDAGGDPEWRVPVTLPAGLVMVNLLLTSTTMPRSSVLKPPDSLKVPGKGPVAVPLTEYSMFVMPAVVQGPPSVDPLI